MTSYDIIWHYMTLYDIVWNFMIASETSWKLFFSSNFVQFHNLSLLILMFSEVFGKFWFLMWAFQILEISSLTMAKYLKNSILKLPIKNSTDSVRHSLCFRRSLCRVLCWVLRFLLLCWVSWRQNRSLWNYSNSPAWTESGQLVVHHEYETSVFQAKAAVKLDFYSTKWLVLS